MGYKRMKKRRSRGNVKLMREMRKRVTRYQKYCHIVGGSGTYLKVNWRGVSDVDIKAIDEVLKWFESPNASGYLDM